jgi:4-hydroxybenzoyl-CoA reductase subunit beta
MKKFSFHKPGTLEEILALLERFGQDEARILAGGTDILVHMKHESISPQHLVSIKGVPDLAGIRKDEEWVSIGAATTLAHVAEDAQIRESYPGLVQAIGTIGSPQIRSQGSIGGNVCLDTKCLFLNRNFEARRTRPECLKEGGRICNIVRGATRCFAIFSADSVPVLIALKAQVSVFGPSGTRVVPIEQIYSSDAARPLNLDTQIVTQVLLPSPTPHCVYLKERWRGSLDFPIVGLAMAVTLDSGRKAYEDVRIALTGVTGFPVRAAGAESVFRGKDLGALRDSERLAESLNQVLRASHPISPMGGLRNYRRSQTKVLLERAATQLADQIDKK